MSTQTSEPAAAMSPATAAVPPAPAASTAPAVPAAPAAAAGPAAPGATAPAAHGEIRTYRGRTVEELIPRIRAELGPGAIILRERQGLVGGIAGFFAQRCVEIEAQAGRRVSVLADDEPEDAGETGLAGLGDVDEERELDEAEFAAAAAPRFEPLALPQPADPQFAERLLAAAQTAAPSEEKASPFRTVGRFPLTGQGNRPTPAAVELRIRVALEGPAAPAPEPVIPSGVFRAAPVGPTALVAPHAPVTTLAAPVTSTAAVSPAASVTPGTPVAARAPVTRAADASTLARRLAERGVSPAFADALVAELTGDLIAQGVAEPALTAALRERIAAALPAPGALPVAGGAIAVVGPGGSGKTRAVAGLAIACARAGHTVSVARLGSSERALELAELLAGEQVEVLPAMRTRATVRAVESARERGLVILDTTSVAPGERSAAEVLAEALGAFALDGLLLAVPAGHTARAALRLASGYAALGPTGMIATHVEADDELGAIAEVALREQLPADHLLCGPGLGGGVAELSRAELAGGLVR